MAPLRYDPSMRNFQSEHYRRAQDMIDGGIDPLSLGFPNLGIPEPVPLLPDSMVNTAQQHQPSRP